MSTVLPVTLRPDWSRLLPHDATEYRGPMLSFWFGVLFLTLITVRSSIHLFAPDGGAHSIATIDISIAGGANIVALFGQWGAIQLVLAALLWVLLIRYRGLTPLVLLTFLAEPFARGLAGHLKPLTTVGTAPGAALNWVIVPVLAGAFLLSLCSTRSTDHRQ